MKTQDKDTKKDEQEKVSKRARKFLRGYQLSDCCGDDDVDWIEVERVERLTKQYGF